MESETEELAGSLELIPKSADLIGLLEVLPSVEFCCTYSSSLLPNNEDKTSMVDYIIGVADTLEWHSENLERNRHHYSRWMVGLGPRTITWIADGIGVGVHFNPFVRCGDKIPFYVVTKMVSIEERPSTTFIPTLEDYVKAAVHCIGYEPLIAPYWSHSIQWVLVSCLPDFLLDAWRLRVGICKRINPTK